MRFAAGILADAVGTLAIVATVAGTGLADAFAAVFLAIPRALACFTAVAILCTRRKGVE